MLVELAVGDAYGAGFEYADRETVRAGNDLSRYVRHPRHRIIPGHYTDDTQMSIALAEAIVDDLPWTREALAQKFVEVFQRDPREGYSGGFYDLLRGVRDGRELVAALRADSDKSGAAMRATPIGVYATVEEVIARCRTQAAITHDTPDGINAAVAAALLAHYFLYDLGPKAEVGHFLERHVPGEWSAPWQGKVKSKGWMSVRAAVTAIQASESLSRLLWACVDYTGDVDTVAAIALAAGSRAREITPNLPDHLLYGLENGAYGRDYLAALDERLAARVARQRAMEEGGGSCER